jgi:hypothetical protein
MPADATRTCPRCGGGLVRKSVADGVEYRVCVGEDCPWRAAVEVNGWHEKKRTGPIALNPSSGCISRVGLDSGALEI